MSETNINGSNKYFNKEEQLALMGYNKEEKNLLLNINSSNNIGGIKEYKEEITEDNKHYYIDDKDTILEDEYKEDYEMENEDIYNDEYEDESLKEVYDVKRQENDINIYDEKVTEVRRTNDYNKFKNILGNRDLRGTNYNRLIQSIQKKQLIIPILVNEKFEIIDGQHRFEVCRRLMLPLYYYVVEGYGIEEVKRANLVGCNWVIDDYLKLNIEIGKKEYIEFKRIKDAYGLTSSQLLDIFANFQGISLKEIRMLFEDGSFELNNINKVIEFLNKLEDFKFFDEYNSYSFTKAFLKLSGLEQYDHSIMKKRIKKHPYKLSKRASYRDYITLLVEIYNFGAAKIRFGYDSVQDVFYFITAK